MNVITFCQEQRDSLSLELCKEIIDRFEADDRKRPGVVGGGYDPELKRSTDLYISLLPEWKEIDHRLFQALKEGIKRYHQKYEILSTFSLQDNGYQVQRTLPSEGYGWHTDAAVLSLERQYTFIWYLNDVDGGGETELKYFPGLKIKPEAGKLFLFPAFWTHTHRGVPPAVPKYIVTGWMSMKDYKPKEAKQ